MKITADIGGKELLMRSKAKMPRGRRWPEPIPADMRNYHKACTAQRKNLIPPESRQRNKVDTPYAL